MNNSFNNGRQKLLLELIIDNTQDTYEGFSDIGIKKNIHKYIILLKEFEINNGKIDADKLEKLDKLHKYFYGTPFNVDDPNETSVPLSSIYQSFNLTYQQIEELIKETDGTSGDIIKALNGLLTFYYNKNRDKQYILKTYLDNVVIPSVKQFKNTIYTALPETATKEPSKVYNVSIEGVAKPKTTLKEVTKAIMEKQRSEKMQTDTQRNRTLVEKYDRSMKQKPMLGTADNGKKPQNERIKADYIKRANSIIQEIDKITHEIETNVRTKKLEIEKVDNVLNTYDTLDKFDIYAKDKLSSKTTTFINTNETTIDAANENVEKTKLILIEATKKYDDAVKSNEKDIEESRKIEVEIKQYRLEMDNLNKLKNSSDDSMQEIRNKLEEITKSIKIAAVDSKITDPLNRDKDALSKKLEESVKDRKATVDKIQSLELKYFDIENRQSISKEKIEKNNRDIRKLQELKEKAENDNEKAKTMATAIKNRTEAERIQQIRSEITSAEETRAATKPKTETSKETTTETSKGTATKAAEKRGGAKPQIEDKLKKYKEYLILRSIYAYIEDIKIKAENERKYIENSSNDEISKLDTALKKMAVYLNTIKTHIKETNLSADSLIAKEKKGEEEAKKKEGDDTEKEVKVETTVAMPKQTVVDGSNAYANSDLIDICLDIIKEASRFKMKTKESLEDQDLQLKKDFIDRFKKYNNNILPFDISEDDLLNAIKDKIEKYFTALLKNKTDNLLNGYLDEINNLNNSDIKVFIVLSEQRLYYTKIVFNIFRILYALRKKKYIDYIYVYEFNIISYIYYINIIIKELDAVDLKIITDEYKQKNLIFLLIAIDKLIVYNTYHHNKYINIIKYLFKILNNILYFINNNTYSYFIDSDDSYKRHLSEIKKILSSDNTEKYDTARNILDNAKKTLKYADQEIPINELDILMALIYHINAFIDNKTDDQYRFILKCIDKLITIKNYKILFPQLIYIDLEQENLIARLTIRGHLDSNVSILKDVAKILHNTLIDHFRTGYENN